MEKPANSVPALSKLAFMDEALAIRPMLARLEPLSAIEPAIKTQATALTESVRKTGTNGVETLLNAYGLGTEEGIALMCLAEALLRIPDARTADAMIEDTLNHHWERYTHSDSWMVSLSGWGLLVGGKVASFQDAKTGIGGTIKAMVARLGEPIMREALKKSMRLIGDKFVLGETVPEALATAVPYQKRGYRFSFDILGEGARSDTQAQDYVSAYREAIALIAKTIPKNTPLYEAPGISIKLSALHPRYQLAQQQRVMAELLPRLKEIITLAKQQNISVSIDAEESTRLDIEILVFEQLLADPAFTGWNGIGFVLQAYQKRAFHILDWLSGLATTHKRIIPVRLVKGAYWDYEIKTAQMQGLPSYPVFTRKEHTDVSYLACADKLLAGKGLFYPQFATHNARTLASVLQMAKKSGWQKNSFELQRLHGMGEALHDLTIAENPTRIYAPIGAHKDLLAYLIRRLLENGANSSFVHQLMDRSKAPEEILPDPIALTRKNAGLFNPPLPLPQNLYGSARKNSTGLDFGNLAQLADLQKNITSLPLATVPDATVKDLDAALATAHKAFPAWAATPVEQRAQLLERAADLLETHRDELVSLCAREAKKTLPDGISEIREAADYCRYYAAEALRIFAPKNLTGPSGESNFLSLHPRGIFAAISPWNFPLAIFIGQVTAALAAGNCVIAKPAEQTPRTAARAVALLYEAGIPRNVLHLITGPGEIIGSALIADQRIAGVVFTGGTGTARNINQQLASRMPIIPFIAETGGQNCMVVDSSSLPEQVVDDVILSAFGSAGQRCSSLRVLFVQEEIADDLLELLAGAMKELKLGDPSDSATDIGPVIDEAAQKSLLAHIEDMKKSAKLVAAATLPAGCFVAPHVFEISSISELTKEHFGPILHVIRFKAGALSQVAAAINSTGYGLTFGIHSRIDGNVRELVSAVRAGNIYVNRSIIGATVGVQPFGGESLSGTGPKAGGPHYLHRFALERTVTVNTAAIGGNAALLSGEES